MQNSYQFQLLASMLTELSFDIHISYVSSYAAEEYVSKCLTTRPQFNSYIDKTITHFEKRTSCESLYAFSML